MARLVLTSTDCASEHTDDDGAVNITESTSNPSTGSTSDDNQGGIRFTGVTVPQGATIRRAWLYLYISGMTSSTGEYLNMWGEDADNSAAFTTTNSDVSGRTTTTASYDRPNTSPYSDDNDTRYIPHEVTDIVQEIVDRGSWASGNAMTFLWTASGSDVMTYQTDHGANAPKLVVVYDDSADSERDPSSNTAGGGGGFTNASNAYTSNNSYATWNGNDAAYSHVYGDFGITGPSGSDTIDEIVVKLEGASGGENDDYKLTVELSWDGGTSWSTAKKTPQYVSSDGTYRIGGDPDGWGHTFTPSELSNANFKVRVSSPDDSDNDTWSLDHVAVQVFYTIGAQVEQEGFAFGDDDGNEASHTLDTQDTNISEGLGTKTLRMLLNATDDPASTAFKLKYQKNGTGGYVDVPTTATSEGDDVVIEASDVTQSGTDTTQSTFNVTLPAYSNGDLVIINVGIWQDNNQTQGVSFPAGPNSETMTEITGGYAGSGNADLPCIAIAYYKATANYAGGTVTLTADHSTARWNCAVVVVPSGEYNSTTPISSADSKANSGITNVTDEDMPAFTANSDDGGGKLLCFCVSDQDPWSATQPSGWTELERHDQGRVAINLAGRDSAVTDSESISAATFDLNGFAFDALAVYGYIVKAPAATNNEVYISASANVAAGGEGTTARLTAPSGKSSGSDFDTGRRWDDENGSDSIDITDDDYTELEWVLTTQSPAADTDYFDFRVYDSGDGELNTYTVTPRWTISAGTEYTKDLTEAITVTDVLVRQTQVAKSESISINDIRAMQTGKNVSETVTIADSVAMVASRALTEVITVTDAIANQAQKNLTEVITIVEDLAIVKSLQRTYTETVTIVDSVAKQAQIALVETITIVDSITNAKTYNRTLSEVIALDDVIVRLTGKQQSETITITDVFSSVGTFLRTLTESITVVDTLSNQAQRTLSEVISITDTVVTAIVGKTFFETITIFDSVSRSMTRALSETLTIVDSVANQAQRSLLENITVSDTISRQISAVRGEIVSIGDNLSKQVQKSLSEAVSIADEVSVQLSRSFSEVLTITDAISSQVQRTFTEVVTITDNITTQVILNKSLSETVAIVENLAIVKTLTRTFSETISVVDSITNNFKSAVRKGKMILLSKFEQTSKLLKSSLLVVPRGTKSDIMVLQSKQKKSTLTSRRKDESVLK